MFRIRPFPRAGSVLGIIMHDTLIMKNVFESLAGIKNCPLKATFSNQVPVSTFTLSSGSKKVIY